MKNSAREVREMAEQTTVTVSDAEINAVEQQVQQQNAAQQKEIEERVRKEVETDAKLREAEAKLKQEQAAAEAARAEAAKAKAEAEALIKKQAEDRMKEQLAQARRTGIACV
jgi:hypothetical protein